MDKRNKKLKSNNSNKALFFQRLVAFLIDFIIVSLIVSVISIPFTDNKKVDKLQKDSVELMEKFTDNQINLDEFTTKYIDSYYKLCRANGMISLLSIFIGVCYYIVFQLYQNGQTIGKKVMKIRIISDDGDLFMNQMIFRSFLSNFILKDICVFLFMLFSGKYVFFYSAGLIEFIQYIMVFASVIMIMYRSDGCAIHDKLFHTRVIREN